MKSIIQAMARGALAQLGTIREETTYARILSSHYETATGEVIVETETQLVNVVFGNYSKRDLFLNPGKIEKNDRLALILPGDLQEGFVPAFGDTITRENGEIWTIVEEYIGLDPAEALYVLQVRHTTDVAVNNE